ncbi:MAG: Nucleolar Complex 2 protein [Thelocarpon superellum]|nr:MAG: Nucleolar Complex 2 protein [Thelocarpon superellum]
MARMKKSTRKFEKNHLKDTIDRRKEFAKIKQRNQVKEKKKAKRAKEQDDSADEGAGEAAAAATTKTNEPSDFDDMAVDQFFEGGFEIPEKPRKRSSKDRTKSPKLGKRKRKDGDDVDEGEEEGGVADNDDDDEDDLDMHKEDLEALAEKDPEFYAHLKENDPELLEFTDLAEVDDLSDGGEEKVDAKKKSKNNGKMAQGDGLAGNLEDDDTHGADSAEVTPSTVDKWRTALTENHSLRAMRQVVLAFRAAVHVNEEDGKEYKYTISNPDVYHSLLILTLLHLPDVLHHHLPVKEGPSGKLRVATDSKKYRTLTPLLKSHASSITHLLTTLSDAPTQKVALSSLVPLLPYLLSFKKVLRDLIRTVTGIWSEASSAEITRINAFLVMRKLMVIGDAGVREAVLRNIYQGLVKGSRNTSVHTMHGVNLMKNSAAELWGLDQTVGYNTGFTFIRQLAIHLRGSITNPSKDSYKTVYNWQYVHSLDFWSRVLSLHCETLTEAESGQQSGLRPLIYPGVQITLGALRLIPTSQYFPLRFQLIRSLLRLCRASGTYIPLAPALLEVLNSAEMKKAPKASTLKSLDFETAIRAPKAYLRTRVYQDGVGAQVSELFSEFFVLWTKSVAFPELALPVIVMLKRWLKGASHKNTGNKNGKVNAGVILLVQKLEANSRFVEEKRASVAFAPNDRAGVEAFLKDLEWDKTPLGAFVQGQRKQREERAKLLEHGRREEEKKNRGRRGGEGVEDEAKEAVVDFSDEDQGPNEVEDEYGGNGESE